MRTSNSGARDFLIFRTSVLAVQPNQAHNQWVLGFNTVGKTAGALITIHAHLVPTLRISRMSRTLVLVCASKKKKLIRRVSFALPT